MAEEGKENQNEGSWWGSWISSAKSKTSTVFEAVKKDLDELSTVVRTEASNVGAAIENSLKFTEDTSPVGNVKKSLSTFFGQVTEALIPSIEDDEVEAVLITHDGAITLTGFQKHLADLQNNDKTYLDEPVKELQDKYKLWLEVIEQDQFTQDRLARHLASSEILNEKYLNFVPDKVHHMDFWQRYLFKRALLEDGIANAEIAERRARSELNTTKPISPRKNIIQTEQPKLTCNDKDIISVTVNNNNNNNNSNNDTNDNNEEQQQLQIIDKSVQPEKIRNDNDDIDDDDELLNENINWEHEEIPSNVELTEEEQIRLLEQYEQEIQEREKKRNENNAGNNSKGKKINNTKSNVITTTTDEQQNIRQEQQQQYKKHKDSNSSMGSNNCDDNNLIVQKDHFNNKDETSSTSDESWEKDFDLND